MIALVVSLFLDISVPNLFIFQGILLRGPGKRLEKLQPLQQTSCSYYSELVEILGVSMVRLECDDSCQEIFVHLVDSEREFCKRCRRRTRLKEEYYCRRCARSVAEYDIPNCEMDAAVTSDVHREPV